MGQNISSSSQGVWFHAGTYPLAIVVEEGLELDNVGVPDNAHDLQLTVLVIVSADSTTHHDRMRGLTLNRLSCSTRLMAASSPLGESLVWKTTPKEPLPTILHCVYARSLYSPVSPSWTFSRMTSTGLLARRGCRVTEAAHLPFSSWRRPMAGSGSLFGGLQRGVIRQACADCYRE